MGDYELYHASTRKHKYIKKIGKRYFYTQQELDSYLHDKKDNDVIIKDEIVRDEVIKDKTVKDKTVKDKTIKDTHKPGTTKQPTAKSSISVGGHTVKNTAQREIDLAIKKQAYLESQKAAGRTLYAAGETKRAVHSTKSIRKRAQRGKAFLKELLAPPKVGHHTTINSGGDITEFDTSNGKTTKTKKRNSKKRSGHTTKIKTRQIK